MDGKLSGVRVLDVSRVFAGPYCTMMLGDMGAQVIKVEPPGGDETRTWPPFYPNGESGYYMSVNRNKKGMVINLKHASGRETLYDLARMSDIFIENFTPGVVKRLAIDYETLKDINPRLIYCSISGFGQTGPYRDKKAYDPVIQAIGGAMSITGVKNGEPVKIGIPVGDLGGSLMAVNAIVAALFYREKAGTGDYIDISMMDSQIAMLSVMAAEYFSEGKLPERWGLEHPWRVPSKTFKAKEGYITTSATSGKLYPILCRVLGLEELIDDPRFITNALRVQNRDILYPIIEKKMMTRTAKEWEAIFEQSGLPNGIMQDIDEVFNDAHVIEREMLARVKHPTIGDLKMIGIPWKYKNSGNNKMTPAPIMGEHTEEILGQVLGYSTEKIADLKGERAVE